MSVQYAYDIHCCCGRINNVAACACVCALMLLVWCVYYMYRVYVRCVCLIFVVVRMFNICIRALFLFLLCCVHRWRIHMNILVLECSTKLVTPNQSAKCSISNTKRCAIKKTGQLRSYRHFCRNSRCISFIAFIGWASLSLTCIRYQVGSKVWQSMTVKRIMTIRSINGYWQGHVEGNDESGLRCCIFC